MYDNGSMKISGNTYNVDVSALEDFIEKTVPNSINKEAARTLNEPPQDEGKVKQAIQKLVGFTKESGKAVWIGGLTGVAKAVVDTISKSV